jgi:hypothetical protein
MFSSSPFIIVGPLTGHCGWLHQLTQKSHQLLYRSKGLLFLGAGVLQRNPPGMGRSLLP